MQQKIPRLRPARFASATIIICTLLLSCGLTALASEEGLQDLQLPPLPATVTEQLLALPEDMLEDTPDELYPTDVQTIIEDGARQIIKTYILTAGQSPSEIPRSSFERDGWRYIITDITEKRISGIDARSHTETVEINTETNDLNEIIKLFSTTLEYQSQDGYSGILTLQMPTIVCEAEGYRNGNYTVTATREYPHLSTNDLSLIPKTITDNGRTLELEGVTWEVQHYTNVDYQDIPDSYRAIAKYSARASTRIVTGYITAADYVGEIVKPTTGDTVYIAYFIGSEINPAPPPAPAPAQPDRTTPPPTVTDEPTTTEPAATENSGIPLAPILTAIIILAALAGTGAYFFKRRNVKIYKDGFRVLAAKDRISTKSKLIDLSPLDGDCYGIEIDAFTAKTLNGQTIEVRYGSDSLKHKIAYEGNIYRIEADFGANTIKAVY